MTLRTKTALAILINIGALIFALQVVFSRIVLTDFDVIEKNQMEQQVLRAKEALLNRIHAVPIRMLDWANWDDTYSFMKKKNKSYIESNLITSAIVGLETNFILYIATDGKITYAKSLDFRNGVDIPFPKDIKDKLVSLASPLLSSSDIRDPINGLIQINNDVQLIGMRPIVTSEGEGPPQGVLVWSRILAKEEVEIISKSVKLPVSIELSNDTFTHEDEKIQVLSSPNKMPIFAKNKDEIVGYTNIQDIFGNDVIRMRVRDTRYIYQQGLKTRSSVMNSIIVVGVLFGLLVLIALEGAVLKRIRRLSHGLVKISETKNLSMRLPSSGSDELSLLGTEINNTLSSLEINQHALIVAREVAEKATEAKSNFVSTMSHEIRTPLNGIFGMLQVIKSEGIPSSLSSHFQVISDCATSLMGVINEVLDFSKIEAGKMTLEAEDFNFERLIRRVINTVSIKAQEKNLSLHTEVDEKIPHWINGDSVRLGQVLINLLGNAIKFTEKGSVTLSVKDIETTLTHTKLHFEIIDTGVGIPIEHQSKIFTAFTQADNSITRRFGGTGLGLTISKQIVELMGGELTFVSTPDVGTTFKFTLSLPIGTEQKEVCETGTKIHSLRILVVDDVKTNLTVAKNLLEQQGHIIECLSSGEEAIQKLELSDQTPTYDVIFMDIQMPGMSGIETSRIIQNLPSQSAKIPIVALTAHESNHLDINEDSHVHFSGWLTKPLNRVKIQSLLHDLYPAFLINDENHSNTTYHLPHGLDEQHLLENFPDPTEIFEIFIEESSDLKEQLLQALNQKDIKGIRASAHALKGSLNNIGSELSEKASHIELLAKKDASIESMEQFNIEEFIQGLNNLREDLIAYIEMSYEPS